MEKIIKLYAITILICIVIVSCKSLKDRVIFYYNEGLLSSQIDVLVDSLYPGTMPSFIEWQKTAYIDNDSTITTSRLGIGQYKDTTYIFNVLQNSASSNYVLKYRKEWKGE